MVDTRQALYRRTLRFIAELGCAAVILIAGRLSHAQEAPTDVVPPPSPTTPQPIDTAPASPKVEELWKEHPLSGVTASIKPTQGELPTKLALAQMFEQDGYLQPIDASRPWFVTSCEWDAPATRHLPLFFEEPNLERLGYTYRYCNGACDDEDQIYASECIQPLVSGVHFFGRIPLLPYMFFQQPLCEPIYTLGVDRPGSPVCYRPHYLLCLKSKAVEEEVCDEDFNGYYGAP